MNFFPSLERFWRQKIDTRLVTSCAVPALSTVQDPALPPPLPPREKKAKK